MKKTNSFWGIVALAALYSIPQAQFAGLPSSYAPISADTLGDSAITYVQPYGYSNPKVLRSINMTQLANKVGGGGGGGDSSWVSIEVTYLLDSKGLNYFGDLGSGQHVVTIDTSGFNVDPTVTPEFYGGLNVHGTLSVGEMDGSSSTIFIGGDAYFGDSTSGSIFWSTYYSSNLTISARQHQSEETTSSTAVILSPYSDDANIGTVYIYGEATYVQAPSFYVIYLGGGGNRYVCVDNAGLFFNSATACVP